MCGSVTFIQYSRLMASVGMLLYRSPIVLGLVQVKNEAWPAPPATGAAASLAPIIKRTRSDHIRFILGGTQPPPRWCRVVSGAGADRSTCAVDSRGTRAADSSARTSSRCTSSRRSFYNESVTTTRARAYVTICIDFSSRIYGAMINEANAKLR